MGKGFPLTSKQKGSVCLQFAHLLWHNKLKIQFSVHTSTFSNRRPLKIQLIIILSFTGQQISTSCLSLVFSKHRKRRG